MYIVILLEPVYNSIQGHMDTVEAHVLGTTDTNKDANKMRTDLIKAANYDPDNVCIVQGVF